MAGRDRGSLVGESCPVARLTVLLVTQFQGHEHGTFGWQASRTLFWFAIRKSTLGAITTSLSCEATALMSYCSDATTVKVA
jgi:hypothetical protein